jgi:hypothetical protein
MKLARNKIENYRRLEDRGISVRDHLVLDWCERRRQVVTPASLRLGTWRQHLEETRVGI